MSTTIPDTTARLAALGLELPVLPAPGSSYLPFRVHSGIVHLAGQTCSRDGRAAYAGPVPTAVSVADGFQAARLCALNLLAALAQACDGDLGRVSACLKVNGFVLSAPGFEQAPAVINGASELFVAVFGDAGRHARTAIGVAALPRNVSVEVDAVFALKP